MVRCWAVPRCGLRVPCRCSGKGAGRADPSLALYRDALSVVRGASLNCYNFDIMEGDSVETVASVVQRNLRIGDACTFRLIAKNVTSLLPPAKRDLSRETNEQLEQLIECAPRCAAQPARRAPRLTPRARLQLVRHARPGAGPGLGRWAWRHGPACCTLLRAADAAGGCLQATTGRLSASQT